jgi:hypothetical protein
MNIVNKNVLYFDLIRQLNFYLASYYSSSSTPKPSNVGFLKSNPISTTSGIIGTSRLHNRREGNVKVNENSYLKIDILLWISVTFIRRRTSVE